MDSEEKFHDKISEELKFPHYYGRNGAAFWDCITDYTTSQTEQTIIKIINFDETKNEYFKTFITLLFDLEEKFDGKVLISIK